MTICTGWAPLLVERFYTFVLLLTHLFENTDFVSLNLTGNLWEISLSLNVS